MASDTNKRGTYAELVAKAALTAAGYEVADPVAPETYDIVARKSGTGEWRTFQVKTLRYRDDKGGAGGYYVLNGTRNNGETYEPGAVDYMIGVLGNVCYLVECTGQSEYWAAADEIDVKWRKLTVNMNEAEAV